MIYLLDTNIVTETSKPVPDTNCIVWLQSRKGNAFCQQLPWQRFDTGLSGCLKVNAKPPWKAHIGLCWRITLVRFLDFDGPAASEWGRYAAELESAHGSDWWKRFDFRDTQIGAIAREYGLTVATRNTKHFPFCQTENPFR